MPGRTILLQNHIDIPSCLDRPQGDFGAIAQLWVTNIGFGFTATFPVF